MDPLVYGYKTRISGLTPAGHRDALCSLSEPAEWGWHHGRPTETWEVAVKQNGCQKNYVVKYIEI